MIIRDGWPRNVIQIDSKAGCSSKFFGVPRFCSLSSPHELFIFGKDTNIVQLKVASELDFGANRLAINRLYLVLLLFSRVVSTVIKDKLILEKGSVFSSIARCPLEKFHRWEDDILALAIATLHKLLKVLGGNCRNGANSSIWWAAES